MNRLVYAAVALVAGSLVSLVTVPVVRRWALRAAMDVPTDRSSHTVPTPRGGGIPIALTAALAAAAISLFTDDLHGGAVWGVILLAVAIIGLIDDTRGLGTTVRFGVQIGAAITAVVFVGRFESVVIPGLQDPFDLPWVVGAVLATVWIVGLTNAYNFMDGIDGLTGCQGAIAGLAWTALLVSRGDGVVALVPALVAGACLGFLRFNWHPASIFMGDVASTTLGLFFATLGLAVRGDSPEIPVVAFVFVAPFVLDATFTFTRRLVKGENVLRPHRTHIYQRLVVSGLSHARVTVIFAAYMVVAAVVGIFWYRGSLPSIALGAATFAPFVALVAWTSMRERRYAKKG